MFKKEIELKFNIGDEVFYVIPYSTGMNIGMESYIIDHINIKINKDGSQSVEYCDSIGSHVITYELFGTKEEMKEFISKQIDRW